MTIHKLIVSPWQCSQNISSDVAVPLWDLWFATEFLTVHHPTKSRTLEKQFSLFPNTRSGLSGPVEQSDEGS